MKQILIATAFLIAIPGAQATEYRSLQSGKCLDVKQASTANGAQVIQYTCGRGTKLNQDIRVKRTGFGSGNESLLQIPVNPERTRWKCLEPWGDAAIHKGSRLTQYRCNNYPKQRWVLEPVAGADFTVRFRNVANMGRCIDIERASVDDGARAILWDCHQGANQKFEIHRW
jgi:endoglucanase